jgi:hypothetical protein
VAGLDVARSDCRASGRQERCCEPDENDGCCGPDSGICCGSDAQAGDPAAEMALPMAPGCALDQAGLHRQLERYGRVRQGASAIEHTARRLSVQLDDQVDGRLVEQLLATERACCPFLALTWEPDERRLTFAVSSAEHEPALHGISLALGLETAARK